MQENEYGIIPAPPKQVKGEINAVNARFCASKAALEEITVTATTEVGDVVFPIKLCRPKKAEKSKIVVFLNCTPDVPDKYLPAEEIIDRGWGFVSLCYKSVTSDDADFNDNASKVSRRDGKFAPGKIAMWAWAAMRVADYLYTREDIDFENIGVAGHSRLGKTALVTAAFDERFKFCHSNDSGTCGAALFSERNEKSESIEAILNNFHYWFCPNFKEYAGKENQMPFDQDILLKLIAPRVLSVGSAEKDLWANPKAEFLCTVKASKEWLCYGKKGLTAPDTPITGERYHDGKVGYYVREGTHYMSREDWNNMLDFFDKNIN